MNAAYARIILRYIVGGLLGASVGDALAGDPDVVMVVAVGVGILVEWAYRRAVKLAERYNK